MTIKKGRKMRITRERTKIELDDNVILVFRPLTFRERAAISNQMSLGDLRNAFAAMDKDKLKEMTEKVRLGMETAAAEGKSEDEDEDNELSGLTADMVMDLLPYMNQISDAPYKNIETSEETLKVLKDACMEVEGWEVEDDSGNRTPISKEKAFLFLTSEDLTLICTRLMNLERKQEKNSSASRRRSKRSSTRKR